MSLKIAYIADGKLYTQKPGEAALLMESPFVQQSLDRAAKARERNDWKSQGMAWQFASNPMAQLGRRMANPAVRRIRVCGLTAGATANQLIYSLDIESMGGMFVWDEAEQTERRLLHRAGFSVTDLCRHRTLGVLALSVMGTDGSANIGVMEADGKGVREITEGDSSDQAPSWVPEEIAGNSRRLLYQSAGIGRNQAGFPVGQGPYGIISLDLDADRMEVLLEGDDKDYLLPKMSADGMLYFIRRPYQLGHAPASPLKVLLDIVLFPFRFAAALIHFANWFSMVFRRKPLITASGPPREGPDTRYLMLYGKMIDAEKALNDAQRKGGDGLALVPSSWELVRRAPSGTEDVLANGVLSFDLDSDGSVVYTNGSTVFRRSASGERTEVGSGRLIQQVVAL